MANFFKRIYYHDTDCGGVVYYANYLKYLEEARTEYLRQKGLDLKRLSSEKGVFFVVRKVSIDYLAPGRYGDLLEITSSISKLRVASFNFYQEIKRQNQVLAKADTLLVCINRDFFPQPIDEETIKYLQDSK